MRPKSLRISTWAAAICPACELTPFCLHASSMSDAKTASTSDWVKWTEQIRLDVSISLSWNHVRCHPRTFGGKKKTSNAQRVPCQRLAVNFLLTKLYGDLFQQRMTKRCSERGSRRGSRNSQNQTNTNRVRNTRNYIVSLCCCVLMVAMLLCISHNSRPTELAKISSKSRQFNGKSRQPCGRLKVTQAAARSEPSPSYGQPPTL